MDMKEIMNSVKILVEFCGEAEAKKRFMVISSKASISVIQLIHCAQNNETLDTDDVAQIFSNQSDKKVLCLLLDTLLLDLGSHPSKSMHELVIKLVNSGAIDEYGFLYALSKNPNLSPTILTAITKEAIKDPYASLIPELAQNIAYNPETEALQLHQLFKVNNLTVRKFIAKHENTHNMYIIFKQNNH